MLFVVASTTRATAGRRYGYTLSLDPTKPVATPMPMSILRNWFCPVSMPSMGRPFMGIMPPALIAWGSIITALGRRLFVAEPICEGCGDSE